MRRGLRILMAAVVLLVATGRATAQELPLSPTATASVLTCGPGEDFYTTFGHSALRICDTAKGVDYVYNYGTFDFNTPHFYWKFAQGMLNYCLSRSTFRHFMREYEYEGRWVAEQQLDLTPQEVSNLFVMLEMNYQPEYRYYRYDFFRDNCATRVRDMVESSLVHRTLSYPEAEALPTYREALALFTDNSQQWWTLGTDLLLGARTDRRCGVEEAMYLPLLMSDVYGGTMLDGHPLVGDAQQLLSADADARRASRSFPPVVAFSLLFVAVAVLTAAGVRRGWSLVWLDRTLYIAAGLAGVFLVFMWAGTDHWCTRWNLNLLWASPLFLLLAIRPQRCPRWSLWLQGGMLVVALLTAIVGWPQHLNVAVIPLILMLGVRVGTALRRHF